MNPTLHLVLVVLALVCFGVSAYVAPQPDPLWKRFVSAGLTALVASMISW